MKMESRNSNLDLYRIICMMMIVSIHYFGWGGILKSSETSTINFLLSSIMYVFCQGAVNGFYIISGFFIKSSKSEIDMGYLKKAFDLWRRTLFYSVMIYVALIVMGFASFDKYAFAKAFFPVLFNQYWFMTIFLLLTLIRPFLTRMLGSISPKEVLFLIVVLGVFDTVQSVFGEGNIAQNGYSLMHAVFMVIIGYYIKKNDIKSNPRISLIIFFVSSCMAGGIAYVIRVVLGKRDSTITDYNSPLIVIASVTLFLFFLNIKAFNSKILSWCAPSILAVYLVNDHPVMRNVIWKDILHCDSVYSDHIMLLHYFLTIIGFMIVGIVFDRLFYCSFDKSMKVLFDKLLSHRKDTQDE